MGRNRDALDETRATDKEKKWEDAGTLPTGFREAPPPREDNFYGIGFREVMGISSYDTEGQFGEQSLYSLKDHRLTDADLEKAKKEFTQQTAGSQGSDAQRRQGWMDFLAARMHTSARAQKGFTDESWEQAQKLREGTREDRDAAPWETAIRQRYANTIREAYGRAGRFGGDRAAQARAIGRSASRAVPDLEQYIAQTRDAEREQAILDFSGYKASVEAGAEAMKQYEANLLADYQSGQEKRDQAKMAGLLSLLGTGLGAGIGFVASGFNPAGAAAGAAIGGSVGGAYGSTLT